MSDSRSSNSARDVELQTLATAGSLATGLATELIRPMREVRESLAVMLEALDRHLAEASGPTPYPWPETKALRERLASAYLTTRLATRLTGDLAAAVDTRVIAAEMVDVNKLVEAAVNLTRHRISADTEVFIDLGQIPPTKAVAGQLVLAVARLLIVAADSARAAAGAAISLRTRRERDVDTGADEVVVYLADNGAGRPDEAAAARVLLEEVATGLGGSFEGTSEPGNGSVFELRWPLGARVG